MLDTKLLMKKIGSKILRVVGKILLGLAILILLLLLFIRSPWGQGIIKDQLISTFSEKTNTEIDLERLFITFSGNIQMEGLYIEDQKGDTLIYSKELEAAVPLWPIIRGKGVSINSLDWNGVRANIIRKDSINGFNFSFIMEAFAPADTASTAQDTTSGGQEIHLGDFNLEDFDVRYVDGVTGIDSRFRIGALNLEMEETDLENMRFEASNASIVNSDINLKQTHQPVSTSEEESPMPILSVGELALEDLAVTYESVPAEIFAQIDVSKFGIGLPQANLAENIINVDFIDLSNSEIFLRMPSSSKEGEGAPVAETNEGFQWPEWNVEVNEIDFSNNEITYLLGESKVEEGVFDSNAVGLQNFNFAANDLYLRNEEAGGQIQNVSFSESSGVNLKNFSLNTRIDNNSLSLRSLLVDLNQNHLEGELDLSYASLENMMNDPENSTVSVNLSQFNLDLEDLFLFQPALRENEYLKTLSEKQVYGQVRAEGTLAKIDLPLAEVHWGESTSITANGTIENVTNPESMKFHLPNVRLESRRGDIQNFVDEEQLNLNLPENVSLVGSVQGSPETFETETTLSSSSGNIVLDGNFSSAEGLSFGADLEVQDLELGKLLNNNQLGVLNLTLTGSGEGENINELDANLVANISSFQYNEYPIEDLEITGEIRDGKGPVEMAYQDDNLEVSLESMVFLDSVSPQVNMSLDVGGANLQALGVTQRNIRVALEFDGSFKGNAEAFDLNAEIEDGVAVYDQDSYLLGDFGISARIRPDSTAMDIKNQIIDMSLRSNTDPGSFVNALQRHYQSYLTSEESIDTVDNPVNLQFNAEIRENPLLDQIFLTNLQELDTVQIDVDFHERNRSLTGRVELPFINYMGNELDSLSLEVDSDRENLEFILGFDALNAGPIAINRTALEGVVTDNTLFMDFSSFYEEEQLMLIQSEITQSNDTINFRIDPSNLILNGKTWSIPETNLVKSSANYLYFQDFQISRNNQEMRITNEQPGVASEHIGITFNNFNLASILGYLNPEERLASGSLDGSFTIEEPYGRTGLLAGIEIQDLNILDVSLGNLTMNAEAINNRDYSFDLSIKEGNADLDLTGGFQSAEAGAQWDTELILNEIQMAVVEGFSLGEISDSEGSFSGNVDLSGTFADPQYEGHLDFNEAVFTVAKLDAPFSLPNETLSLDNEGVYFDDFNIEDQDNNRFTINGEVLTESFLNPEFDLNFQASDFMVMNSTSEDNELYYGKAVFDVDAELTGTLNVPRIDLDLVINSDTDLTYIIPESQVGVEERDGVVLFVNKEDPDNILTESKEESYTFTGMEVSALINIEEEATFNVIINEQTGDNFEIIGTGDLNFNIYPNGRTTLSGRYEMSGGHYEMNLYGLVNRRFEIVEGSSITWAGDPFDANLDLRARYRVETSASSLMAARTSSVENSEQMRFRQELPFFVYLDIGGELMQPVLSFALDMPEEEQGSLGGEVYSMVQQVNQQEQELNKQVFSLLVLNRFYPESGSDGSGGGTMALARDNLNNALSDQLNMLSNNLLGDSGFQLDFGLDSYTDYQGESPQERTQLDITAERSFMDERLVVRVGSEVDVQGSSQPGESTPLIGNVSIEYLLTESGKWRLKGFRRNRYENVMEGQVIVSGLALIFTREFNEFQELWDSFRNDLENTENQE